MKNIKKTIETLIDKKEYNKALELIDMKLVNCGMMRECINYKAVCYLGLNRIEEAEKLFEDYNCTIIADETSKKSLDILISIKEQLKKVSESKRYATIRNQMFFSEQNSFYDKLNKAEVDFCKEQDIEKVLSSLIKLYYESNLLTEFCIAFAYAKRASMAVDTVFNQVVEKRFDLKEFVCSLINSQEKTSVIVRDENNTQLPYHFDVIKLMLSFLFEKCFVTEKNSDDLFDSILGYSKSSRNKVSFLFASFSISKFLYSKNIYRIIEPFYKNYEDSEWSVHYDCFIAGDYLDFASYDYSLDVPALINAKSEVDFSIIIPIRNTLNLLPNVIATCLDQDYSGTYEILISDNSDSNKTEILDYFNSLNNPRVRYVHTPKVLSLSKSFEFAYLNARGQYIISLGSDDGILKNGLDLLKNIIDSQEKTYDLILCNRPIYFWPVCEKELRNKLLIRYRIVDESIRFAELDLRSMIEDTVTCNNTELELPYTYQQIISRNYLIHIYEKTGKLFYGDSQDIYQGVLNEFLIGKALYINLPIVIAGISTIGTGYSSTRIKTITSYLDVYKKHNYWYRFHNYCNEKYSDFYVPFIPFGTVFLTYREFLKICGFLSEAEAFYDKKNISSTLKLILDNMTYSSPDNEFVFFHILRIAKKYCDDYVEIKEKVSKKKQSFVISRSIFGRIKHKIKELAKNNKVIVKLYFKIKHKKPVAFLMMNKKGIFDISGVSSFLLEKIRTK